MKARWLSVYITSFLMIFTISFISQFFLFQVNLLCLKNLIIIV